MKKIIFCTPKYLPDRGGVEQHVSAIASVLTLQKFQVVVITQQTNEDQKLFENIHGVSVYRMPIDCKSKVHVWGWMIQHIQLFLSAKIVHAHDVSWWMLPLLPIVCRKFFITFHGWEGVYPVPMRNKLHRLLMSWCAAGTLHIGAYIQQFYWDTPTEVIYGGVVNNKIVGAKENLESLHFVFVGRLEKENDIALYIELFKEIKINHPEAIITWVGDGSLRNECEQYGRVTGMVSSPEKFYRETTFVCAASYLSILEAIREGKQVISLYSHPLKKVYLKTFPFSNVLILGASPREVIKQVEDSIINRAQHTARLLQAQLLVHKEFTWKKVAQTYLTLWKL